MLSLRDTESARDFQRRLVGARRVVVVGNGGIATELVCVVSLEDDCNGTLLWGRVFADSDFHGVKSSWMAMFRQSHRRVWNFCGVKISQTEANQ